MQFYRRSSNVTSEMDEMSAEGKKSKPLSSAADRVDGDGVAATADNVDQDARPTTVRQLFMDVELRRPLFIACALVTIQQFSGINAVRTRVAPSSRARSLDSSTTRPRCLGILASTAGRRHQVLGGEVKPPTVPLSVSMSINFFSAAK